MDVIRSEVNCEVWGGGGTFERGLLPAAEELLCKNSPGIIADMWASVRQLTITLRSKIHQRDHIYLREAPNAGQY